MPTLSENVKYVSAPSAVPVRSQLVSTPVKISEVDEYLESQEVSAKVEFLDNLPDEITAFISAVIDDTMLAYRTASTENLKIQLAPLLPSTD